MSLALALKLSLVPLVVWLASEAGRRWGHAVSGWLAGLPLIAAPISVFLALDPGPEFSARTAHAILQSSSAAALHCLVFAAAAQRFGWLASLLAAWGTFLVTSLLVTQWTLPLGASIALAFTVLTVALLALPRAPRTRGPVAIPRVEIIIRMSVAFAIAAVATLGATTLGARWAGILLTFPISGTVLPAFSRALYGGRATAQLLRGFMLGLYGFAAFFVVVALALPKLGLIATYALASVGAVGLTLIITRVYAALVR